MKITEIFELLKSIHEQGFITLDEDGDLQETDLGKNNQEFHNFLLELEQKADEMNLSPEKISAAEELFKEYFHGLPLNQALKES